MEARNKNNCHNISGLQITDQILKKERFQNTKLLDMIISQNCLGLLILASKIDPQILDQYLIGHFTKRSFKCWSV